ncbi:hypothetical protein PF002_g33683 [Phytophthora fragariae]|uniref:Uncharacterized protein n=1 Tax=Phytophthora fragariae TaxID=53985 RepID=A0A6A3V005_9STRA|nr:hypothetical protein PF003_g31566 [Phytophthora fragariae]KAE8916158.1 hypothetical protein PF009_g33516 [Phytophthora fragariae]KAE9053050.1 hypothetical protein PF006_g33681 [Phytophthora fragariae]KAE9156151.1 hypothetical protein PF002_g33683 [Phytophthora fragariae]KAE9240596.1 hypothetical protein PF001_g33600 [Phytophthora fragariae]
MSTSASRVPFQSSALFSPSLALVVLAPMSRHGRPYALLLRQCCCRYRLSTSL